MRYKSLRLAPSSEIIGTQSEALDLAVRSLFRFQDASFIMASIISGIT